jgi:hypothetical protein
MGSLGKICVQFVFVARDKYVGILGQFIHLPGGFIYKTAGTNGKTSFHPRFFRRLPAVFPTRKIAIITEMNCNLSALSTPPITTITIFI